MMNNKEQIICDTVQFMRDYLNWTPTYRQDERYGYIKGYNYCHKDDPEISISVEDSLAHLINELTLIYELLELLFDRTKTNHCQFISLLSFVYSSDADELIDSKVLFWKLLEEEDEMVSKSIKESVYVNGKTDDKIKQRRTMESCLYLKQEEVYVNRCL